MKTRLSQIHSIATTAGLVLAVGNTAYPQQSAVLGTTNDVTYELVQLGDAASFSVNATSAGAYQWLHNGSAIAEQTNSTLTLESAQISDAGFYSCLISDVAGVSASTTGSLEVFTFNPDFDIVVFAAPIVSSGGSGSCPGPYKGYVTYIQTNGWGWLPNTNTTLYTATDNTRTNTKVEYGGNYGDEGCAKTTVTIPYPAASPAYRFAIYFTNNVPTTNYPITLVGFTP
jgi:hypothetical protein